MPVLETPFAQLQLIRQPEQQNEPLQAFDAADEYLLNHLAEQGLPSGSRVLVLNDSFGALAISLVSTMDVTSSSDSCLAIQALEKICRVITSRLMRSRSRPPANLWWGLSTAC